MTPPKTASAASEATTVVRGATVDDAAAVWALVDADDALDLNSPYAYLLGFHHHAATSVVAEDTGKVVGFVLAYRPPEQLDTVFVWQVGVAPSHRRQGLGKKLLHGVLRQPGCEEVRFMEATVTPSNEASKALFGGIARDLDAEFEIGECFRSDQFPTGHDHEREDLIRIGPFAPRPAPPAAATSHRSTEEPTP